MQAIRCIYRGILCICRFHWNETVGHVALFKNIFGLITEAMRCSTINEGHDGRQIQNKRR